MSDIQSTFDLIVFAQSATPWINPDQVGGYLGAAVGVFGGVYGAMVGALAPRGKCKTLVLTVHWAAVAIGVSLIVLGIVALLVGQPYGVWFALCLPGFLLTAVLLPLTVVVRQRYHEAEQRRLEAENFRRA